LLSIADLGVVVKDIGNIGNTGGQAKGVGEKVNKRGEGRLFNRIKSRIERSNVFRETEYISVKFPIL